ncbi:MAG: ABC transporter ATP-binding protein [Anaerolineae bacterium]
MNVIETNNLTKAYSTPQGAFTALHNLDLTVHQGEIFGYLGPNGAGKTTTIRMLLDFIRPTSGRARVLGLDAQKDSVEIHKRVGFLPGELNLWKNQKSIDIVRYFGRVRGGVELAYVHELAERLQFDLNKRVREYSTGNKRKLGLILALMHKPELLILDEPTSGLDPLMQQTFNQLMRDIRDEGRTVFLSSHILSEVQAICERVAVLRGGELKAVERVDKLTHAEFRWVTVRVENATGLQEHLAQVPGVGKVETVRNGHTAIRMQLNGDFDPLLRALSSAYVIDLHVEEPTLEDIFLAFYDNEQTVNKERVS